MKLQIIRRKIELKNLLIKGYVFRTERYEIAID